MIVIMDNGLQEKLEVIKTRESWAVVELAKILGRPHSYVYRRLRSGNFDLLNDGSSMKVLTSSVVKFYKNKIKPISIETIEKNAFNKGLYTGLKLSKTADEFEIDISLVKKLVTENCMGS